MFDAIVVHPRVHERHSEIEETDAVTAWRNAIAVVSRVYDPPDIYSAAGADSKGRLLELIGIELDDETLLIYHAMKLTSKKSRELGLG